MNRFRKHLAFFCTVLMMTTPSFAFANFLVVTPEQVIVNSEGLFVEIEDSMLMVDSISMANDGFIVAIPNPKLWYCPVCKKHVAYPQKNCPRCGSSNPRDQG